MTLTLLFSNVLAQLKDENEDNALNRLKAKNGPYMGNMTYYKMFRDHDPRYIFEKDAASFCNLIALRYCMRYDEISKLTLYFDNCEPLVANSSWYHKVNGICKNVTLENRIVLV